MRTSHVDTPWNQNNYELHFLSFLSHHRRTRIITVIPYPPDKNETRARDCDQLPSPSVRPTQRAAKAVLSLNPPSSCSARASQSAVGLSSSEIDLSGRAFLCHVYPRTSQDAPRHHRYGPVHRVHSRHVNTHQNNALPGLTWGATQTDCISHHTHIHRLPTHRFPTRGNSNRPRSGPPRRKPAQPPPAPKYTLQSTSPSTRRFCTMPSTPTLGHCTLATCTVLLCNCTKCWEIPPMRRGELSSGVTRTHGVCCLPMGVLAHMLT
jgi:hypothetical protein